MSGNPTVLLIATLDTKIDSVTYLAGIVRERGCIPLMIDVGALSGPEIVADFSNAEVMRRAGKELPQGGSGGGSGIVVVRCDRSTGLSA